MHSSSQSAKRRYFQYVDGKLVAIDDDAAASTIADSDDDGDAASTMAESDDDEANDEVDKAEEQARGTKRAREEETEDESDDKETQSQPIPFYVTRCGIVADGVEWNGNSQCVCAICMGEVETDEEED